MGLVVYLLKNLRNSWTPKRIQRAPESVLHTGGRLTESQKPAKQSATSPKKGDGQEMRGIWDVRTGESVKSRSRDAGLLPR